MRFTTLDQWLHWQETLHPSAIELGLERPGTVLRALGLGSPSHAVITVAGTNGKGSSVAMLEAILLAAGYRVGCYTSPHLLRYNERIRINGEMVSDQTLCESFERIDGARGETSLTYFEFGTLAAFDIFSRSALDVAVLEVGLGGRLDAVNLLDADVALITAIDVDHSDWLGNDRETIALEKAGVLRPGRAAVCSDSDIPASLLAKAEQLGVTLYRQGAGYGYQRTDNGWQWWGADGNRVALPEPGLRGRSQLQNAAGVLMVLELLTERLPVSAQHLRQGLLAASLKGRFQIVPGEVELILDVAHNTQAAQELAANLAAKPCSGRTLSVVAMLADKAISEVIAALEGAVDEWYLASLDVPRGANANVLQAALKGQQGAPRSSFDSVTDALAAARQQAQSGDRIVIFGSFYTVTAALEVLQAGSA